VFLQASEGPSCSGDQTIGGEHGGVCRIEPLLPGVVEEATWRHARRIEECG
jgi:hypothetical protein